MGIAENRIILGTLRGIRELQGINMFMGSSWEFVKLMSQDALVSVWLHIGAFGQV